MRVQATEVEWRGGTAWHLAVVDDAGAVVFERPRTYYPTEYAARRAGERYIRRYRLLGRWTP